MGCGAEAKTAETRKRNARAELSIGAPQKPGIWIPVLNRCPCKWSEASFFLVSKSQYVDPVVGRHMAVQCDIAGISERNDQFAQIRLLFARPMSGVDSSNRNCPEMTCAAR